MRDIRKALEVEVGKREEERQAQLLARYHKLQDAIKESAMP